MKDVFFCHNNFGFYLILLYLRYIYTIKKQG